MVDPEVLLLRPLSSDSTEGGGSREEAEDDERESGTLDAYRSSLAILINRGITYN